jgi:hypothetical protein
VSSREPRLPQVPQRGEIWWAFVEFAPASPFEIWDEADEQFIRIGADVLAREIREMTRSPVLEMVVGVKLRPVVVMQTPRERIPEYLTLKLARLEKLSSDEIARVERGGDPSLFYLGSGRYGQSKESAVDLNSLARIGESAFPTGRAAGKLDANMMRVLDERLAKTLELDLDGLIKTEAARLLEEARSLADQADDPQ